MKDPAAGNARGLLFPLLMRAAEYGRLPDSAIRLGIRHLLRARLADVSLHDSASMAEEFIERMSLEPIAVDASCANEQHYELPPAFFEEVLGPNLKYSSCYWPDGITSLGAAEDEALRVTCKNADIEDGMNILELGCGWGALSLWMAQRYRSCRITSVSNSSSQRTFIERQAAERGLSNLTVVTADITDYSTDKLFDRIVSVEMFEHMRNHRALTRRIHGWLRPGGRLFVHVFCHRKAAYLFDTDGPQNWMGRHFFTGGMMPSRDLLPVACDTLQLVNQWRWNGTHYAKTCRAWLANQDAARAVLKPVLMGTYGKGETVRWHNRWRLFFMACEELFAFNGGSEWFVSHYLFER